MRGTNGRIAVVLIIPNLIIGQGLGVIFVLTFPVNLLGISLNPLSHVLRILVLSGDPLPLQNF